MRLDHHGKDSLLDLAKTSTDKDLLSQLALNLDTLVRRAVAGNRYTSSTTLSKLVNDPVMNVAFVANSNPNWASKREFSDSAHPCVQCDVDERRMKCSGCEVLQGFYN